MIFVWLALALAAGFAFGYGVGVFRMPAILALMAEDQLRGLLAKVRSRRVD